MSALLDQPEQVARYWRQNIPGADWFDPMKEALVVLDFEFMGDVRFHNLLKIEMGRDTLKKCHGQVDVCGFLVWPTSEP